MPLAKRTAEATLLRYPILVQNKQELLEKARRDRIELGSWFKSPLHPIELKQHRIFDYTIGQCPNAERVSQQIVNLPMHKKISLDDVRLVTKFLVN